MLLKIFIFAVSLVLGYLSIKYNYWIVKTLGKSVWAENHFPGATFGLYKLVGIGIMILGFLHLIGTFD
jgi:hypothetical protein